MNLNQITLPSRNIKESREFYLTLGLKLIVENSEYLRFECPEGNSTISVYLELEKFGNAAVVYFEHKELDSLVEQLIGKGIEFRSMPEDTSYLWREAILDDPSGNEIRLYWAGENRLNPPWRILDRT